MNTVAASSPGFIASAPTGLALRRRTPHSAASSRGAGVELWKTAYREAGRLEGSLLLPADAGSILNLGSREEVFRSTEATGG
jgi:hypothetical protein